MFISDIADINPETKKQFDNQEHIKYLDTSNITKNIIDEIQFLVVGKDKIPSRAKRKVTDKDFIYSTVRPNNKHFGFLDAPPKDLVVSTGFVVVRVDPKKANPRFVYEYLTQDKFSDHLLNIGEDSTSTYPGIKPDDLSSIEIDLPPRSKQNFISTFASIIDNKINLYQKMNETLEEIAKTLFKSWFIDFDPVIAKVEGRSTELSKEISDLFPTSFEESKFGVIPQGWEVKRLDEVADFQNGYSFSSREYVLPNEDSKEVFRMGYIERGGGFKEDNTPVFVPTSSRGNQEKYVLRKNDLTISMTDMKNNMQILGCCALIEQDERFLLNQRVGRIRVKESAHISPYYLYIFMNFPKNIDLLCSRANSGVQVNLSTPTIKETNIILPSKKLSQYFAEIITPFYQKIFLNNVELKNLKEFRNTLLPKLISGELKTSDVDKLIEEVGD